MKKTRCDWNGFFKRKKQLLLYCTVYAVLAIVSFEAMWASWDVSIVLMLCAMPVFVKKVNGWVERKHQVAIEAEFYKLLGQLSMAVSSGMSIENAMRESIMTGKKEYKVLSSDLEIVYRLLQNNYSVEYAFGVLAKKTHNEEIKTFTEILSVGIPAGINLAGLMRWISSVNRVRTDTEGEISRILNAPKYNNRIVMAMPVVCIVLFKNIAPSYIAPLYSGTGRIIMGFVLFIMVIAWVVGEKISVIDY